MKSVQELSRRLLRFEPEASLSESGNISEASAMYEKAYRKIVQDEGETSVLIGRMLDLIEKEASNPKLSLKWAARNMLYMNPDYLGKLFKQETGEKFSSYVAKVRIEKAIAKMKKSKNTAIGTLAEELGFGHNPKYFSLVFKNTRTHPVRISKKRQHVLMPPGLSGGFCALTESLFLTFFSVFEFLGQKAEFKMKCKHLQIGEGNVDEKICVCLFVHFADARPVRMQFKH